MADVNGDGWLDIYVCAVGNFKGLEGSKVTITCGERSVNAASMLSLLSLGIKSGTALVVSVDGGEEAAALEAVVKFIESIKE